MLRYTSSNFASSMFCVCLFFVLAIADFPRFPGSNAMAAAAEMRLGPLRLPEKCRANGHLTPEQRQAIKAATGASASCRQRNSWPEKGLVVCGPRGCNLVEAETMAMVMVVENASKQNGHRGSGKGVGGHRGSGNNEEKAFLQVEEEAASSAEEDGVLEWVHNKPPMPKKKKEEHGIFIRRRTTANADDADANADAATVPHANAACCIATDAAEHVLHADHADDADAWHADVEHADVEHADAWYADA